MSVSSGQPTTYQKYEETSKNMQCVVPAQCYNGEAMKKGERVS